jgi:DUF1680 family protein
MGLIKLFHVTGNENYLNLAKYFLDIRGPHGQKYNQAHLLPADQTEAVGHSVRATYMYSAMADIAALQRDTAYLKAITKMWEDITFKKMYVTGGIGATGGNEGFAGPYELPNLTAYCETCASIGNIFFNHRLFLHHGNSEYIDVLEKTLYNSMLSGVSLSADSFFYPNPLESDGRHARQPWFGCACCPSNVARFMPAIPGYIYAVMGNDIYTNLFISNDAVIHAANDSIHISQKTGFPWDGRVEMIVTPSRQEMFTFHIRIPGWARNEEVPGALYKFADVSSDSVTIRVNNQNYPLNLNNGYAVISREWSAGDKIEIHFPMPVRKVVADERISDDRDRLAFQRGPFIYCAEWPDNNTGNIRNLVINTDSEVSSEYADLLGGIQIITTKGSQTRRRVDGKIDLLGEEQIKLIPYAYWNNRGAGEMAVWLPTKPEAAKPLPARTIAFLSKVRASKIKPEIKAVNDQAEPGNSGDKSIPYYSWFPAKNSWEYVQYDFAAPEIISKVKVYWADNRPEETIRVPDEWEVLTLNENVWEPVVSRSPYRVTIDGWDSLTFSPVRTRSVKIKVKLNREYSGGIYEWIVQ